MFTKLVSWNIVAMYETWTMRELRDALEQEEQKLAHFHGNYELYEELVDTYTHLKKVYQQRLPNRTKALKPKRNMN